MIELTVESARLREKQLENEISNTKESKSVQLIARENCFSFLADLRNELTKEQDSRQKLEEDILKLQRVRSRHRHWFFIRQIFPLSFSPKQMPWLRNWNVSIDQQQPEVVLTVKVIRKVSDGDESCRSVIEEKKLILIRRIIILITNQTHSNRIDLNLSIFSRQTPNRQSDVMIIMRSNWTSNLCLHLFSLFFFFSSLCHFICVCTFLFIPQKKKLTRKKNYIYTHIITINILYVCDFNKEENRKFLFVK